VADPSAPAPAANPHVGDAVVRVSTKPSDANAYGDIFGGWLLVQMDEAAGLMASRRTRGRTVTVAIDGMQFLSPVRVGDEVSVFGEIVRTGRSSLHIHIQAWRRERHGEQGNKVTEATFVFVAVDDEGRPRPIEKE